MAVTGRRTAGAVAVLVLALGGCAAQGGTAAAPADEREQALRFTQCLRDNGLDVPDPEAAGGPVRIDGSTDPDAVEAAMEACEEFAPDLAGPGGEPLDQEQMARLRRFAQCMRDNGLPDFPDPDAEGGIVARVGEGGLEPDGEAFRRAEEACRQFGPQAEREDGGAGS
jgi:hypothetical protein